MKRVILVAATVGFLVALATGCAWYYLYNHGLADTRGSHLFAKITHYSWPAGIMMMDADRVDFGTILLFLTASIANAFIYGIVACCIYVVWRKIYGTNRTISEAEGRTR